MRPGHFYPGDRHGGRMGAVGCDIASMRPGHFYPGDMEATFEDFVSGMLQ